MLKNIPTTVAACLMGKRPQWVRVRIRRGLLNFGVAAQNSSGRWSYWISQKKFQDETGYTEQDIIHAAEKLGVKLHWTTD